MAGCFRGAGISGARRAFDDDRGATAIEYLIEQAHGLTRSALVSLETDGGASALRAEMARNFNTLITQIDRMKIDRETCCQIIGGIGPALRRAENSWRERADVEIARHQLDIARRWTRNVRLGAGLVDMTAADPADGEARPSQQDLLNLF